MPQCRRDQCSRCTVGNVAMELRAALAVWSFPDNKVLAFRSRVCDGESQPHRPASRKGSSVRAARTAPEPFPTAPVCGCTRCSQASLRASMRHIPDKLFPVAETRYHSANCRSLNKTVQENEPQKIRALAFRCAGRKRLPSLRRPVLVSLRHTRLESFMSSGPP